MVVSRVTDQVGRVLGGRYRLIAPIGSGASAQVYLADDVVLRRRVAIKLLRDDLAADEGFLRRFRAEAQSSAQLSHPNIVAVFDWGEDAVPYIVTEFLAGGSLRSLLDRTRTLSLSQVLLTGLEAARGLEHAHRRGFVHRDLKPANLLYGDDGRLRIADFGLARALAEAAWTEPQGAVLGTARYASPEQAQGNPVDGRGDVYSLALVLIEAATGRVPFASDTTIGTLMARVDRPIPVGPELGPLRGPLERAGRIDPDERPDAGEFAVALMARAEELERPEPLPIVGSDFEANFGGDGGEPTELAGSMMVGAGDRPAGTEPPADAPPVPPGSDAPGPEVSDRATNAAAASADGDRTGDASTTDVTPDAVPGESDSAGTPVAGTVMAGTDSAGTVHPDSAPPDSSPGGSAVSAGTVSGGGAAASGDATPAGVASAGRDGTADEPGADAAPAAVGALAGDAASDADSTRSRRWPWLALAVVGLLAGAAAAYSVFAANDADASEVPNLVRSTVDEARLAAADNGWTLDESRELRSDAIPAGQIVEQSPPAGESLEEGETLFVTVSLGPRLFRLPDGLIGQPQDEAEAQLDGVEGLERAVSSTGFDEEQPAGLVLRVLVDGDVVDADADASFEYGTFVELVISDGPEPRTIPDDLVGLTFDDALAEIEPLGLFGGETFEFNETVPAGRVIRHIPEAGETIDRGGTIDFRVSLGPELITVPDYAALGSTGAEACADLAEIGLACEGGDPRGDDDAPVRTTDPQAGDQLRPGTEVLVITDD